MCYNILILMQISFAYVTPNSYKDLKTILTKKNNIDWLDRLNNSDISPNPYCHICCLNVKSETIGKQCGVHTLCKFESSKPSPKCKGYIEIKFTSSEIEALIDAHNTLRNYVATGKESRGKPGEQPPAANMRAMTWNDELAVTAQRWVQQCVYRHDACRDLDSYPVGQNMAYGNFATNNLLSFIKQWYEEVIFFNRDIIDRFRFQSEQHSTISYTQLVWAETYQIGCARAAFQTMNGSEVIYTEHFFCNYGPSGNLPKQPVYLRGSPCSACQEGTTCALDYPSLCEIDLSRIGARSKVQD